jgi:aminomethyltransferase
MSEQTTLHAVHTELGATFTDFAGWAMPLRYGSDVAEHHAVRNAAGIFDLSHMGEIEIAGERAAEALDGALVGNISAIRIGRAKYTMICDEDGGIIDDLVVYRLAEVEYLIVANASNVGTVAGHLNERVPATMAKVVDSSRDWSLIAVQGPRSAAIIAAATGHDVASLKYYAIEASSIGGQRVLLARTGYTGEDGFEVYCRPDAAADIWRQLTVAGEPHAIIPAGLACRDSLRLEAGMPLYGQELTLDLTPFEAGLGRVVALDKGTPFVGQAALRARKEHGLTRTLVGLSAPGRRSPRTGHHVIDPITEMAIGVVTSGIPSPTLGHAIAMAYVPVTHSQPGTELAVDIRGRSEAVTVVELPFYRRPV